MSAQGKGAKSKKLNETDEERAMRIEAEAAAAQEGARRREEAARCASAIVHLVLQQTTWPVSLEV